MTESLWANAAVSGAVVALLGGILAFLVKRELARFDSAFKDLAAQVGKLSEAYNACTLSFVEKFRTKEEAEANSNRLWASIGTIQKDLSDLAQRLARAEERHRVER